LSFRSSLLILSPIHESQIKSFPYYTHLQHPVPEINTPIFQPTLYRLIPKALKDLASEATAKAKKKNQ